MRIEPKQAFYNEDTGAVQPWKDIEVTDAVGNALVAEGLVTEIEGGGGGSSDFSTATIHIVNPAVSAVQGHCPRLVDVADGVTYAGTTLYTEEEEQDFTVILYGHNGAFLSFDSEALTYATSGNIERIDPDYPDFLVTGDCTVTVSQE